MAAEKKEKDNEYNAKGSPEMREIDDDTAGFKKGGAKKPRMRRKKGGAAAMHHAEHEAKEHEGKKHPMKDGGHAEGKEARERMDRPKRSRHAAGGRTPYSSGSTVTSPATDKAGAGHEGERPVNGGGGG